MNTPNEQDPFFKSIYGVAEYVYISLKSHTRFSTFLDTIHYKQQQWMVSADFSLSKDRPWQCLAFTIYPYDADLRQIVSDLSSALPSDIKDSRRLPIAAPEWFQSNRRYHVAIRLKHRTSLFADSENLRRPQLLQFTSRLVQEAESATGFLGHRSLSQIRTLATESKRKAVSTKLISNIAILAAVFSGITCALSGRTIPIRVGWFPDRDNMTAWSFGIWQCLSFLLVHHLSHRYDIDLRPTELLIGTEEHPGSSEELWFDPLIVPCDWIAGTLASWNGELGHGSNLIGKYKEMHEKVIQKMNNLIIIDIPVENGVIR